jgi:hypothetical protein
MDQSGSGSPTATAQVLNYDRKWIHRLLAAAEEDNKDPAVLEQLLWLLNTHDRLPGLVQIFRHISEIGKVLYESPETDSLRAQISTWSPLLAWLAKGPEELKKLATRLFPETEAGWELDRNRFIRSTKPNPLFRHGFLDFGLPGALWASHPRPHLQKQYRSLQGQVLNAHIIIAQREFTFSDWQAGLKPNESFRAGQYDATWAVRRFATDEQMWHSRLAEIKFECSQSDLIERLGAMADSFIYPKLPDALEIDKWRMQQFEHLEHEKEACESGLRSIASFLDWSVHPDARKKRPGGGGGGGQHSGTSAPHVVEGGAGDEDEDGDTDPTIETSYGGEGHSNRRSEVHLPNRWRNHSERYRATIKAGDHPAEAFASQPQAMSDDATGAAFARGGGIEISNQLLPWAFSEMSVAEMGEVLVELNRLAKSGDPQFVEVLALVETVLWTGASLKRALTLAIGDSISLAGNAAIFLQINPATALPSLAGAEWKIRPLELEFKSNDFDFRRVRQLADPNLIVLPVPQSTTHSLEQFLHLQHGIKGGTVGRLGSPSGVVQPFEKSSKTYEDILARCFADPTLNVSFGRISKILFRQIYQQTAGDVVAASLLTGTDHYLASVRRHYCTPRVGDLQGIYGRAITSIATALSVHSSSPGATGIPIVTSDEASIGSPICPTDKSLAKAFMDIREDIRRLKNAPLDRRKSQFQRRHNLYTLYSVLAFGVAAAMRGVSTPYLHLSDVDDQTGFAVVTDKDSGSGYKSRLVWLPEVVQKQMRYYENYLSATSKYLNLKATKKKMPCCYFLDKSGDIEEVRPKSLAPHLKQYLDLPANAARHWTCTHLREGGGGLSRETVDALMGHWWRGEEPWGPFSSFSYAAFRKEIADPISQIYTDLKFRPLQVSGRRGGEQ